MSFTPYGSSGTRLGEIIKQTPINYIQWLLNLPADTLVRVYSYQSKDAFKAAEERGYWTGGQTRFAENDDKDFNLWDYDLAYDWIKEQMSLRIPNYSGDYPMWGWLKRPSTKNKPCKYMGTKGDVRITALVPRGRILFSDYQSYHSVLDPARISYTEEEHEAFYEEFGQSSDENGALLSSYIEAARPTWQRCLTFQVSNDPKVLAWGGSRKYFRVQMCIDRIHWNEVVQIRRFV